MGTVDVALRGVIHAPTALGYGGMGWRAAFRAEGGTRKVACLRRHEAPGDGTQHFRNIHRHSVETDPTILTLRIDESLYFANARFLEDYIYDRLAGDHAIKHVVLMCSAINEIDFSALESLEAINARLKDMGIKLHLSEVKGPVMDRLQKQHFIADLTGKVFLSQHSAFDALKKSAA